MAEKTKLKWLRKEFSSSEELEYYLTQLKHQDKLKSDVIALLERFQHLLFQDYEPDFLTISYNGQWDVSFSNTNFDDTKQKAEALSAGTVKSENLKLDSSKNLDKVISEQPTKPTKIEYKLNGKTSKEEASKTLRSTNKEEPKSKLLTKATSKTAKTTKKTSSGKSKNERVDLNDLIIANLLNVGTKLRYKNQAHVLGVVTREGTIKVGKEEYSSLSGAATSLATSGRRDGWLCWFFQDSDGEWKTIDLLRQRWKERFRGEK